MYRLASTLVVFTSTSKSSVCTLPLNAYAGVSYMLTGLAVWKRGVLY